MHHYTYMITCLDNWRYYIGVRSCDVPTGDDPYMGSSDTLDEAIDRRGADRFIKKIIREFDSRQAALEHEIYLHSKYDVKDDPRSYNLCSQTSTGFDTTGLKHSEEQRAKKSKAAKRRWEDEEYRAKNSEAHSKAVSSPECRAKMSKAAKRRWEDEEYRAKRSEAHSKAVSSPETRAKISAASKRMWENEEHRAKISAAMKRIWDDEEFRAKMTVTCPHCGKTGRKGPMTPHHFNNCKQRGAK